MASLDEQLRAKTAAVQHLLHKVAVADAKEEAIGTQLVTTRAELLRQTEQVQILQEAMEALSEQLKRRTLEAEAAEAAASRHLEQAQNTAESLQEDLDDLRVLLRTKDDTISALVERLERYEKTFGLSALGPVAAPPSTATPPSTDKDRAVRSGLFRTPRPGRTVDSRERARARTRAGRRMTSTGGTQLLRRNSGPGIAAVPSSAPSGAPSGLKRILRPFTGASGSAVSSSSSIVNSALAGSTSGPTASSSTTFLGVPPTSPTPTPSTAGASDASTGVASGFVSHFPSLNLPFGSGDKNVRVLQSRITKLEEDLQVANEALAAHKAQNAILNEEVLRMKLGIDPTVPLDDRGGALGEAEPPLQIASSLQQVMSSRAHTHAEDARAAQRRPIDGSLHRCTGEPRRNRQAMEDDALELRSPTSPVDDARIRELTNQLPIPADAPMVPGYDRYGFMENDVLSTGSEALLRRIEKKVGAPWMLPAPCCAKGAQKTNALARRGGPTRRGGRLP